MTGNRPVAVAVAAFALASTGVASGAAPRPAYWTAQSAKKALVGSRWAKQHRISGGTCKGVGTSLLRPSGYLFKQFRCVVGNGVNVSTITLRPTGARTFTVKGPLPASPKPPPKPATSPAPPPATTSPTPAPPPAAPAGSTRDNPIPLGQPIGLGNGWNVTVTNVTPDATQQVLAANQFNDPPSGGNQFFMVSVTGTYYGQGSSTLDPEFVLRAVGASNVVYTTFQNSCGVLPDPDFGLDDPEVFGGGSVSGNICWQVASGDAAGLMGIAEPSSGATQIFFALR